MEAQVGRMEKEALCLLHGKICAECDGKDVLGYDCKFRGGEKNVGKDNRSA